MIVELKGGEAEEGRVGRNEAGRGRTSVEEEDRERKGEWGGRRVCGGIVESVTGRKRR